MAKRSRPRRWSRAPWPSSTRPTRRMAHNTSRTATLNRLRPSQPETGARNGLMRVLPFTRRPAGERAGSPDRDFQLQLDVKVLPDAAADQVDQPQDVARGRAAGGDNVVGVAVTDLGAADARPLHAGLVDQV